MTYLDYSATTPIDEEVLDTFVKASKYIGNPNSLHSLGIEAKELIDASTKQIAKILGVKTEEIIYTSGASESNNTVIKGIEKYKGKKILTTPLEHSSINAPLSYLSDKGYEIEMIPLNNGIVEPTTLKKCITDDTVLITIGAVNSETGIRQPIEEIGKMLKKEYPNILFHTDVTQGIGKIKIDLTNVDMASFAAHKFFGIKGIGGLIKKENIKLTPLIHGGKSTTIYRSGTPTTQLIASMAKALRLAYENIDSDIKHITKLNNKIKENLKKYDDVYINSTKDSIPHILNISIVGIKPETMLHALEKDNIYISTQSACATGDISLPIMSITNDKKRASSSIRISISRKTTEEEINIFLKSFDKNYRKLKMK
ncbi:MAG: cysteine desulfurase [Bacilli bacterium]|nr:cysteine desulfurase [Bacilli bacterium]